MNRQQIQSIEHVYQPIWKLDTWDVFGYEALLRLPDTAMNHNIESVLEQARVDDSLYELDTMSIFWAIQCFPFHQLKSVRLFINVFPSTLLHDNFESFINQTLQRYPQAKGKIVFELSETRHEHHIWRFHELKEKISFLKENQFQIALNDIGKEAATFEKINEFSPDIIKLDRYFARDLSTSREKQHMVSYLIEFEMQGILLILEGIEEAIDLASAKLLRVPAAQGYLLGHPEKIPNLYSWRRCLSLPE